jgi:hypothetical protein
MEPTVLTVAFGLGAAGLVLGSVNASDINSLSASTLKLDGSNAMNGPLNLNDHPILGAAFVNFANKATSPTPSANSTNFFSTGPGNLSQTDDTGTVHTFVTQGGVGNFLPRDGSLPMQGNLDMANFNVVNVANLLYLDGSAAMTGSLDMGNFNVINVGNLLYLDGSAAMTSNLNLNNHNVINAYAVVTPSTDTNVRLGSGTTVTSGTANVQNIFIGAGSGATGTNCIVIGANNNQGSVSAHCVMVGDNDISFGANAIVIGSGNTVNGANSYILGTGSATSAAGAMVLGDGVTNSVAQTLLFGTGLLNIRPAANAICDIGTSSLAFNNGYFATNVYVNNLPLAICQYSTFNDVVVDGAIVGTAETNYSNAVDNVGSLSFPPLAGGTVINVKVLFSFVATNASDTLTLRLYGTAPTSQLLSAIVLTFAGSPSVVPGNVTYTLCVRTDGTMFVAEHVEYGGLPISTAHTTPAFVRTSPSTFAFTAQWAGPGTASNSFTNQQLLMVTQF